MADLNIHLDIRVTPSVFRWGLMALLLSSLATELASESVTLTTYYPAPSGVYTNMITTNQTYLARGGVSATAYVDIGTTNAPGNATTILQVQTGSVAIGAAATTAGTQLAVMGGNVGIGTTNAVNRLEIQGGTAAFGAGAWPTSTLGQSGSRVAILSDAEQGYLFMGNMLTGVAIDRGAEIFMGARGTTGTNNLAYTHLISARENSGSGNFATYFQIKTMTAGASENTGLRMDSSGNVGIGTTSPIVTLDVAGNGIISARQTGCTVAIYSGGANTTCGSNAAQLYATLAEGIYVERWQMGNIGNIGQTSQNGSFYCCPRNTASANF